MDLEKLSRKRSFKALRDDDLARYLAEILTLQQADRQENQLLFYKPVSPRAMQVHESGAKFVGVCGGNGSSKTETCMVDLITRATGVYPESLKDQKDKFRGPVNQRIIVESLTTVLHPIILPKLKWWVWTGVDEPGGERGHWGWVPKQCLKKGSWEKSWSEKLRMLTVLCHNPDDFNEIVGESTIQFMSHDQDPSDFASGDFHDVMFDEPSSLAIWRENEARTMRVDGRMFLAMTWPDDPAIPVDWIYDEVYDRRGDDNHDWFELQTTDNPHLNQDAIRAQMKEWDDETIKVRIMGQGLRFSNRIHPLFTDFTQTWCFRCGKPVNAEEGVCKCGSQDVVEYNHVREFDHSRHWPTVFLLDPHPRKPHMFLWVQIDPSDDLWVVAEGEITEDAVGVRDYAFEIESDLQLSVELRLVDPNMGRTPTAKREITWQDEFDQAGLFCNLADDSSVGRKRLNEFFKPDGQRLQPRIHIHPRCENTILQIKRYVWDDHKRKQEKDLKQTPKTKYDDYPTLLKYLMNYDPNFRYLHAGAPVIRRSGTRRGAY